jgi:citronellol/citronellal dehydrogenase
VHRPVQILVNNASALWWKPMEQTPMKRFDLIHSINARGTFAMTTACLPTMRE